jgi:protein-L-isoaspartate(D-aspartate) O-methyltransferase
MEDRERAHSRALAARLAASGALRTPRWITAFETVPRSLFVPRFFADPAHTGAWELIDGTAPDQHDRWPDLVYRDTALVTQIGERGTLLSSSSQPSLMARMLEALDFAGGERVLEIGTGTGYNAALLCAGLGSEQVTSVDIDAGLVRAARDRLRELGYTPALAVGDGADGHPGAAPYDRIIATCSLPRVPAAWIGQAAPGGLILVNLFRELGGGALALLKVSEGQASGHFASFFGGFMATRTMSTVPLGEAFGLVTPHLREPGERRQAMLTASALSDDAFDMIAALLLPGVHSIGLMPHDEAGARQTWLVGDDGSWACQEGQDVRQDGPRRLWDQLERLHQEWSARGRPARHEFGLTVTASGEHHIWLTGDRDWPARA